MNYYAIFCKGGQEFKAEIYLNQQFKGRCFCPAQLDIKGKRVALWPNYVLLQVDLDKEDTSGIKNTRGVLGGLLRFGNHFPVIPDDIAEAAKGEPIAYEQAKQIRVLSGAFENFILEVESMDKGKIQAWVEILGKPQLVNFDHDKVVTM